MLTEFEPVEKEKLLGGEEILFMKQVTQVKRPWTMSKFNAYGGTVYGMLLLSEHYLAFFNSGTKKCKTVEQILEYKGIQISRAEIAEIKSCLCWAMFIPCPIAIKLIMRDGTKNYFTFMKRKRFVNLYNGQNG